MGTRVPGKPLVAALSTTLKVDLNRSTEVIRVVGGGGGQGDRYLGKNNNLKI